MSGAIGSILTNSGALAALNGIAAAQQANTNYQTQLSSGKSINSPADNPAGYIQAQGFTSQLNGITQAMSNANEGVSLLQTAQGAVNQQLSISQKLNSIAVQAANGTQTPQEAQSLQGVVAQLTSQITTISQQTQFNNINLLDGTFSGVQFQVGANEGQTIALSVGSTSAANIGMYHSNALSTGGIYNKASGSNVNNASAAYSKGTTGAAPAGKFGSSGSMTITGSNGAASIKFTASSTTESAKTIADQINTHTNVTNVYAQAKTQATITLGTSSNGYSFTLGNGTPSGAGAAGSGKNFTNGVTITANNASGVINAINAQTAVTGITAKAGSKSGNIVLTQSSGANIGILNGSSGVGAITSASGTASAAAGSGTMLIQGKVQLQSDSGFSVASGGKIGLAGSSELSSLASINVSTTSGANSAINVVKYAIQGLNNLGGQLGASQQRLQATLNNLTTTSTNLNNGLATVQDANIPQVSQKLTQTQIQAQAGVAALKSSSQLQQAYLSLLP